MMADSKCSNWIILCIKPSLYKGEEVSNLRTSFREWGTIMLLAYIKPWYIYTHEFEINYIFILQTHDQDSMDFKSRIFVSNYT